MSQSKWSKPTLTKETVIAERKCGLKIFDAAVEKVGKQAIIDEAIRIHNDPIFVNIWGPNDCWSHFDWAFGNAWKDALDPDGDISSTFNLDEALTETELETIRSILHITEPLDFGIGVRINGIRYHHCPRHDNPEKYAYR